MLKAESRNMMYRSEELITLKDAKIKFKYLKYLGWLKDYDLGIVVNQNMDDGSFAPVTYEGKQLFED